MTTFRIGVRCRVFGRHGRRRRWTSTRRLRQNVTCRLNGNGFVEIERALENGLAFDIPRPQNLTPSNGVFKVMENEVEDKTMHVTVHVPLPTGVGERVVICGDSEEMGHWKLDRALQLKQSSGNMWTSNIPLPPGSYEFKCVRLGGGDPQWEPGDNRVLQVPMPESNKCEMEVTLDFGQTGSSSVTKILRETIVMNPDGGELFRMVGGNGIEKLNRMFNLPFPSPGQIPTSMMESEIHDVTSHPLTEEDLTASQFLRRELKLEKEELAEMLRRCPDLRFKSVKLELQPWLEFFLEEIKVRQVDLVTLAIKRPGLLGISTHDMGPVTDYFVKELGMTPERFLKFLIKQPGIFHLSVEGDIRPKVELLKVMTDVDDEGVGRILMGCSELLSKEDDEIRRRIHNLSSDLGTTQCSALLLRYPSVLSMRPETVARKVSYLTKTLQRSLNEIISFPFCLSFSLEQRITKRFQYLNKVGIPHQTYSLATILRPKEQRFFKMIDKEILRSKTHLAEV